MSAQELPRSLTANDVARIRSLLEHRDNPDAERMLVDYMPSVIATIDGPLRSLLAALNVYMANPGPDPWDQITLRIFEASEVTGAIPMDECVERAGAPLKLQDELRQAKIERDIAKFKRSRR